ncbi:MAG: hypothetical protein HY719_02300 [Planctomycetes bacterium]|nr:hypothetical protein [Planctomycetota bacterium]
MIHARSRAAAAHRLGWSSAVAARLGSGALTAALLLVVTALPAPAWAEERDGGGGAATDGGAGSRYVGVIAHRCAGRLAPENTLAAVRAGKAAGADMVEMDVRTTKDGALVLCHDGKVDRTTNGHGNVADLTLDEVRALDAGSWFNRAYPGRAKPEYVGEKVPTFDEVVKLCKELGLCIYLDHKALDTLKAIAVLQKYDYVSHTLVYHGLVPCMHIKQLEPRLTVLPPVEEQFKHGRRMNFKPECVDSSWPAFTPELIEYCKSAGIEMVPDSLNTTNMSTALAAAEAGCHSLQTDYPDLLSAALAKAGLRAGRFAMPGSRAAAPTGAAPNRAAEPSAPGARYVGIVAHRCCGTLAPENTLAAIRKAKSVGVDMCEVDVQLSKDGVPFVFHDPILNRTTPARGFVNGKTWEELKTIDNGSWFNRRYPDLADAAYADERIASLDEVVALLKKLDLALYLDYKRTAPAPVIAILKKHGFVDRTVINASLAVCRGFKEADPAIHVQPPLSEYYKNRESGFLPDTVDSGWETYTPEIVAHLSQKGIAMVPNVLGEEQVEMVLAAAAAGAIAVQTDRPDLMAPALEKAGLRAGRFLFPWERLAAPAPPTRGRQSPTPPARQPGASPTGDEEFHLPAAPSDATPVAA